MCVCVCVLGIFCGTISPIKARRVLSPCSVNYSGDYALRSFFSVSLYYANRGHAGRRKEANTGLLFQIFLLINALQVFASILHREKDSAIPSLVDRQ